jgi:segregation and condensation protein B
LKNKIEAILFARGKIVSIDELKLLLDSDARQINKVISQLQKEYDARDTSLQILKYQNGFKLSVKSDYFDLVKNLMPETEMPKAVIETLAIVAWKHPKITQSEIIHIRSSNAYDHLKYLEKKGFIKREPEGKSKRIILTSKFFNYFDIDDLKAFQENLNKYDELEDAYNKKINEVKDEELKIKTYNNLVKKVLNEESKKIDNLKNKDMDDVLDKEEEDLKLKGVQVKLDDSKSIDSEFLSKKINEELEKEYVELEIKKKELQKEFDELDEKKE